jgi:hypothetical protein
MVSLLRTEVVSNFLFNNSKASGSVHYGAPQLRIRIRQIWEFLFHLWTQYTLTISTTLAVKIYKKPDDSLNCHL